MDQEEILELVKELSREIKKGTAKEEDLLVLVTEINKLTSELSKIIDLAVAREKLNAIKS